MGEEGVYLVLTCLSQIIIKGSQGRKSGQELTQRPSRNADYWLAHSPLLDHLAFLYNLGPLPRGGMSTVEWALSYRSLIKKIITSMPTDQFDRGCS